MAAIDERTSTGISFALTDEQKELRALAREFAEKEIRPKAAEYDEHQTHPADIIAKAHEIGLMNLHLPASLGGLELSAFDGALVAEELNWGCSGIGTSIGANGLASGPILIAGMGVWCDDPTDRENPDCWRTEYPAPPEFDGEEWGAWNSDWYERTLTQDELGAARDTTRRMMRHATLE